MSTTENALGAPLPPTEFKHQALMITVLNGFKERVSDKGHSLIFHKKTLFIEFGNSLHKSGSSLNNNMEIQEVLVVLLQLLYLIHKLPKKNKKF